MKTPTDGFDPNTDQRAPGLQSDGAGALEGGLQHLASFPAGARVSIRNIEAGRDALHRLTGLGIRRGVDVTVQTNTGKGPLVVNVGLSRVAIGRGIARRIFGSPGP